MNVLELSPLFRPNFGFDRMARMLDSVANEPDHRFPAYNIETQGENAYRVTMAVPGFAADDLDVTLKDNELHVSGHIKAEDKDSERGFLHRGIAERAFERRFSLAEHVEIKEAELENGLLHIGLVREVPEEKKPRKIAITHAGGQRPLDAKAA